MNVSVYSYNILYPEYANFFSSYCDPTYLKLNYRWEKLKVRILEQIGSQSILCLQELSTAWISLLNLVFQDNDYYFVYDTQKLGVGIAFPNNKYKLVQSDMIHVGQRIKKNCREVPRNCIYQLVSSCWKKNDYITEAIDRRNLLLYVSLQDRQSEKLFNVFTYHMPCVYWNPTFMMLQGLMIHTIANQVSVDTPYMIVGDFNIKPTEPVYESFLSGKYTPEDSEHYTVNLRGILPPLRSVYKEVNGHEPCFTNYVKKRTKQVEFFSECLDYIFVSSGWEICSTLEVPYGLPPNPLPNSEEPSDHIPIGAVVKIQ